MQMRDEHVGSRARKKCAVERQIKGAATPISNGKATLIRRDSLIPSRISVPQIYVPHFRQHFEKHLRDRREIAEITLRTFM
jgi:hypothetical protein